MEVVAGDIGGTHARFAIAEVDGGRVVRLGEPVTLPTIEQKGLAATWSALGQAFDRPLPRAAALGAASASGAAAGGLTDDIWSMSACEIDAALGTDRHLVLNDFGAVAHAVQHAPADQLVRLCGPDEPLPDDGVITVCGPGTGIGCAQLVRRPGSYQVLETEGGHIGFAPTDAFEDRLVIKLRERHGRVSAERVCAGPALVAIYELLAKDAGWELWEASERAIWAEALERKDDVAVAALNRFCGALGGLAGDLALAQGAHAVVIAGGLGLRLRKALARSRFGRRFRDKGRFEGRMARLPVKLITHPQPGLFGAASAFAARFG